MRKRRFAVALEYRIMVEDKEIEALWASVIMFILKKITCNTTSNLSLAYYKSHCFYFSPTENFCLFPYHLTPLYTTPCVCVWGGGDLPNKKCFHSPFCFWMSYFYFFWHDLEMQCFRASLRPIVQQSIRHFVWWMGTVRQWNVASICHVKEISYNY